MAEKYATFLHGAKREERPLQSLAREFCERHNLVQGALAPVALRAGCQNCLVGQHLSSHKAESCGPQAS